MYYISAGYDSGLIVSSAMCDYSINCYVGAMSASLDTTVINYIYYSIAYVCNVG